jgi:hypothetical protein
MSQRRWRSTILSDCFRARDRTLARILGRRRLSALPATASTARFACVCPHAQLVASEALTPAPRRPWQPLRAALQAAQVNPRLELESDLYLQVAHRLRSGRCAEPSISRLQAIGIERSVRQVLRIQHGQVGGTPILHRRVAVVDHDDVEGVERVEPELKLVGASNSDVPTGRPSCRDTRRGCSVRTRAPGCCRSARSPRPY